MKRAALDQLCDDLGDDDLRAAFVAIARVDDPDVRAFVAALEWVAKKPDRSPIEKLRAIKMLFELPPGQVFIPSAAAFLGWNDAERQSHN